MHSVWADFDGEHVRINTTAGRAKHRNMEERSQVTILSVDPENPFRWLEIRGTAENSSKEGAAGHVDKLAKDYLDLVTYPGHTPDEDRITIYVKPTRVLASGQVILSRHLRSLLRSLCQMG